MLRYALFGGLKHKTKKATLELVLIKPIQDVHLASRDEHLE
jgi:hypothetical protein